MTTPRSTDRSTSQSAPPVTSLEARYYTSAAIFNEERRGLLATTWQLATHVSQLANPGDYIALEIAGQQIFCVRDKHKQLRGFYNVCQHRAHELVSGTGNAKLLVCPYHSWTYELDGQLRSGPNLSAIEGFDRSQICLTAVAVEEFCGFVFVNLDLEAKPMEHWFPNARQQLREYVPNILELEPLKWVRVEEQCNWKVAVENYSECYHCKLNHPTFANGVVKPETYNIQPQGYCLRHTTECQNLDRMSYTIDPNANAHAGSYSSWFLWPLCSFQVYPGNLLNTYHWRPLAVDKVEVWRGWYTPTGQHSDVIEALAQQDRETTVEEDIHLVESVQRGLNSRGYRPGPLVVDAKGGVNSEHSILALQQWIRDAIDL